MAVEGQQPAAWRSAKVNEIHVKGAEGLRQVYRAWAMSLAYHGTGARRLPQPREKLFKLL